VTDTPEHPDAPASQLADLLEAQATALEAQARVLRGAAVLARKRSQRDELLDAKQCHARYGVGGEAIRGAAHREELAVVRGARGKLLVADSELRRWLESRPYRPGPRRAEGTTSDLDAWEAEADAAIGGRQ
jgi:hypothetical protein